MKRAVYFFLTLSLLLSACAAPTPTAAPTQAPTATIAPTIAPPEPSPTTPAFPYLDPSLPVEARVDDVQFSGMLPYTWPRNVSQLPLNINNSANKTGCDGPLFPFGYGLTTDAPSPDMLDCK